MSGSPKLATKLAAASKSIGVIEKGGFNAHFKFHFQSWEQVVGSVQHAFSECGLWIVPGMRFISCTPTEGKNVRIFIEVTVTIFDTESDEHIESQWIGESIGSDDKGTQKAGTSAFKYLLLKLLMIPSEDDSDPDAAPPTPTKTNDQLDAEAENQRKLDAKKLAAAAMKDLVDDAKTFWPPYEKAGLNLVDVMSRADSEKVQNEVELAALCNSMMLANG